tara:strand:- start:262 stop:1512 length:1251 start_codon:yes stop_codon:yes gene_type:complete
MDKIEKQYNEWIYPNPIEDIKKAHNDGLFQTSNADLFWDIFYPEKKYSKKLKVFIAGCGSSQAISLGISNPKWEIYAIDLSAKAIELNENQIKKYNLKNVKVEKKNILNVNKENEFDLVISSGVIHHTKDPKETLKKIVSTANEDGAINIMVYASYLRVGVYYLQSIFKYMNVTQNQEGVDLVKFFLQEFIQKNHYVSNYEIVNTDKFDAGIVDTYLNPQDKAYDILELGNLLKNTGSYFQNWNYNFFYYPDIFLKNIPDKIFDLKNLNKLSPFEAGDFTQKLLIQTGKLDFILRKKKYFENFWHNKKNITGEDRVKKRTYVTSRKKGRLNDNFGGSVFYGAYPKIEIPFNAKQGIIWSIIVGDKNESKIGIKIDQIELQYNRFANDNNMSVLKKKEIIDIIYYFWKLGIITLQKF